MIRYKFLGSGTSSGVPVIGCKCPVCISDDPRDKRTRASLLIEKGDIRILIDASIDFRFQALRESIDTLTAVILTHAHADHIFGLDEVRVYSFRSPEKIIPIHAAPDTLEQVRTIFSYSFNPPQQGGGVPNLRLFEITSPFDIEGIHIEPVPIWHGKVPILGFKIGKMAYLTDCSKIDPEVLEKLHNLDVLILGAIRHKPHSTHFSVSEAVEVIKILKPKQAYLTHISHMLGHEATNKELPEGVELAFDGLTF